jgi:hypothetical protein
MLAVLGSVALSPTKAGVPGVGRAPVPEESFPGQWSYVTSEAKRIALKCGRQWGKTSGHRLRARRNLSRARRTLYIHMVRDNANEQFFQPLMLELADAGWEMDTNETHLIARATNGGVVKAWSADDVRAIRKGRGFQWDDVILDESQSFPEDVITPLMDHVIIPTLFKTGGSIVLSGTPPEVEGGYFIRSWEGGAWERHGGAIFENPHIPAEHVREAYATRGIGPGHPIWEREVMGLMVTDPDALAYEYRRGRNDYTPTEGQFDEGQWRHSMGLDLGFQDADAIVVLGWRRDDAERRLYERFRWQANHLDVDQLAVKVREVVKQYRPVLVGDHGGHGAVKVLETLKSRMGLEINAKPTDVMASVGLVNDDFRAGRLLLEQGSPLGDELLRVTRQLNPRTGRLEINKQGFHSDLSEALRYAHHAARHWASKPPKKELTINEQRRQREQEQRRREDDPYGDNW